MSHKISTKLLVVLFVVSLFVLNVLFHNLLTQYVVYHKPSHWRRQGKDSEFSKNIKLSAYAHALALIELPHKITTEKC
jgi:hypothetical protein